MITTYIRMLSILMLLLVVPAANKAQSPMSELKEQYAKSQTPAERLYSICQVVKEYSDYHNCDSISRWTNLAANERVSGKKDSLYKETLLNCLGALNAYCREDYNLMDDLTKKLKTYTGNNTDLLIEKNTALYLQYNLNEEYEKAYDMLRKVYLLAVEGNRPNNALYALYHLAVISDHLYKYEDCRKYLENMLSLAQAHHSEKYVDLYRISIGKYYFHKPGSKKYDSSIYYMKKLYNTVESENIYGEFYFPLNLAEAHVYKLELDGAREYLLKAEPYLYKMPVRSQSTFYFITGLYYVEMKQNVKAAAAFKRAITIDENNKTKGGDVLSRFRKYEMHAMASNAIQDYKSAYQSSIKALGLNVKFHKLAHNQKLVELDKKFQTQLKEKENALLKAENVTHEIRLKRRNFILVFSFVFIAVCLLLAFFILRNYKKEKRHAKKLAELNRALHGQHFEIKKINDLLQLKVLRTQMNPHFIYNSLNSINHLVLKGENDKAAGYLLSFSKLLRLVLDFSDKDSIDLEEEIGFIDLYLSLEAMRMDSTFHYEINTDKDLVDDDISIPALLIQPFIENAIWHGLTNKEGDKKITVNFKLSEDDSRIICSVDDNGIGRKRSAEINAGRFNPEHRSKGLRITQERIEMLTFRSKDKIAVTFTDKLDEQGQASGTCVKIVIPIDNK